MANAKKNNLWLNLSILSLIVIFAFTCQNHFWHPKTFFFNMSSKLSFIHFIIDHTISMSYYLLASIFHQLFIACANTIDLDTAINMVVLLCSVLTTYYLLLINNHLIPASHKCTSKFLGYRKYFIQNSRAIIPLP